MRIVLFRVVLAVAVSGALTLGAQAAFPDAHNPPPAGWTGPVFKLSQSYPSTLPPNRDEPAVDPV